MLMSKPKQNPFKPGAGFTPPLLIGRDTDIDDFIEGLDNGPGAPSRLMRITGARGIGKTVLLSRFAEIAKTRGWDVIRESASNGLTTRLVTLLQPAGKGKHEFTLAPNVNVAGMFGGSLGSYHYESPQQMPLTLTEALRTRITTLEHKNAGLLILIDEAQAATQDDMVAIANAAQTMNVEGRDYALVFAGLPSMSSKWLNNDATTFMRRAEPHALRDIPLDIVSQAFAETFAATDKILTGESLQQATSATYGYPFMIQLVGYYIWSQAQRNHPDNPTITLEDTTNGIGKALSRLGETVHGPELDSLSSVDRTYLLAMAQDDGPSSTSVIAERLGKGVSYAGNYRARLLEAQVIENKGYGLVDFAIPYLRQYLKDHIAYYMMQERNNE